MELVRQARAEVVAVGHRAQARHVEICRGRITAELPQDALEEFL